MKMTFKSLFLFLLVAVTVTLSYVVAGVAEMRDDTEKIPIWKSECFSTLDGLVDHVNKLPNSNNFHVVTVPSQRNVGGWLGSPYCLLYPGG